MHDLFTFYPIRSRIARDNSHTNQLDVSVQRTLLKNSVFTLKLRQIPCITPSTPGAIFIEVMKTYHL